MSTPTEFFTDGPHRYACTRLPATRASLLLFQLASRFGEQTVRALALVSNLDGPSLDLFRIFLGRLDPDAAQESVLALLGTVRLEGKPGTLAELADSHFQDHLLGMYSVAFWALRVQFGPIFAAARNLLTAAAAAKQAPQNG